MNPLMNEMLAEERTQRREQEIANRELIKKTKLQRPASFNLSFPLKKFFNRINSRGMNKKQVTALQKTIEVLD